jgi:hypothetical protein
MTPHELAAVLGEGPFEFSIDVGGKKWNIQVYLDDPSEFTDNDETGEVLPPDVLVAAREYIRKKFGDDN